MSAPTCEAIAFLQDGSDFDLGIAAKRLTDAFPCWEMLRQGNRIAVRSGGWEIRLHLAEEPFVAAEARDIAEHFAESPRAADIAECKRRVEVCSTDPDPDMEHFNDYVFVCQVLAEFGGVIRLDPQSGELI